MSLTYSIPPVLGSPAPEFSLPGVDGKTYGLAQFKNSKALAVIFMCNHCPYVIAVQERINAIAKEFASSGLSLVAINSNDTVKYPDDSFEEMKIRSKEQGYVFPYLLDETQEVAKAYQAACTPDPYVYENVGGKFLLRYHGRIDDNWKDVNAVKVRELAQAIAAVLEGRPVAVDQKPSMGCNIKWKA